MTLDFSRTSKACAGPVNISRSTAIASCYVALKHLFQEVPANSGVLEPIRFVIPDGCLLDAKAPKPVGGYTETILRVIDVVFQAMAKLAPERSNGCAYGTINALSLAGHRQDGRRWVMFSFFGGGHGAHPEGDGLKKRMYFFSVKEDDLHQKALLEERMPYPTVFTTNRLMDSRNLRWFPR